MNLGFHQTAKSEVILGTSRVSFPVAKEVGTVAMGKFKFPLNYEFGIPPNGQKWSYFRYQ